MVQAPELMLTIAWNPSGFHLIDCANLGVSQLLIVEDKDSYDSLTSHGVYCSVDVFID
jgi:hypothetical protein